MLHLALFVPDGEARPPESVLDDPELRRYHAGFGEQAGDLGLIVSDTDTGEAPVGACWLRRFTVDEPGYGFVAPDVPELSIALVDEARNQGVGTVLIERLLGLAAEQGTRRVSLSVDARSPARQLYQRLGFVAADEDGTSITMVADTAPPPGGPRRGRSQVR